MPTSYCWYCCSIIEWQINGTSLESLHNINAGEDQILRRERCGNMIHWLSLHALPYYYCYCVWTVGGKGGFWITGSRYHTSHNIFLCNVYHRSFSTLHGKVLYYDIVLYGTRIWCLPPTVHTILITVPLNCRRAFRDNHCLYPHRPLLIK